MVAVAATDTAAPRPAGASRRRPRESVVPPSRMGRATGTGGTAPSRLARAAALVAAGLATASVPLHIWMLAAHSHGLVLSLLMGAMTLWCLWCAAGTVRRVDARPRGTACPRTRALRHLWLMAGVMALLHVVLLTGVLGGGGHAGHGAGAGVVASSTTALEPGGGTGTSLMLAIIVVEVAVCFACAMALRTRQPGGTVTARQ